MSPFFNPGPIEHPHIPIYISAVNVYNARLAGEGRRYLLIGVGRWGSTDPWLGIPVSWDQISGARVIVEAGFRDLRVTPSQGSHFFQNLTSFQVGYFTVNADAGEGTVDWDWLAARSSDTGDLVRHLRFERPLWSLAFAVASSGVLGVLGIIAGLYSDKVDELAAFQNFIILPLTFLSGVFYSIQSLPPFWQWLSHLNPIFYMVDGFRYGFFGAADVSPWISLAIVCGSFLALSYLTLWLLRRGYKLRY